MRKGRAVTKAAPELTAKTTAVIYIRVSSKEQQQEGFSLDAQLQFLLGYARKNDIEVLNTYMDVESAKTVGRTQFGHLMAFLKQQASLPPGQNPCLTVLVEKTDRFYRTVDDMVTIREIGAGIHLVKEGTIMTPNAKAHEKFVHGLNVLLAERMVNNLSEETQKGMQEKARQGIWPSFAPIGYKNVEGPSGKRIIIKDDVKAPLVAKMFELYATGLYSTQDLCREAAKIGLVHRGSKNKLTKSAMYDLITNPIYYGDFYWKGVLYNGTHKPIIEKSLFEKVQKMLDRRSSCPTGRQKHDFLFRGMITCGHCGCAVVAEIHKGKYVYYRCTHNKGQKCPDKYVREEVIEQQYVDSLSRLKIDNDVIDWIVAVMQESTVKDRQLREAQVADLAKQKQKLEGRLDKMYCDRLDGILDEDEYRRFSNKFRNELTDVKIKLEQIQAQNVVKGFDRSRVLELAQKAASLYSAQIPEEKRKLLSTVYSNSTFAGGEVKANFNQPFDIIAVTNEEYQRKKVTSLAKSDLFEIWRPRDDSNVRPLP